MPPKVVRAISANQLLRTANPRVKPFIVGLCAVLLLSNLLGIAGLVLCRFLNNGPCHLSLWQAQLVLACPGPHDYSRALTASATGAWASLHSTFRWPELDDSGCIVTAAGDGSHRVRRFCGAVSVKYAGRSGNALLEHVVTRYAAESLGFAFIARPVTGLGKLPASHAAVCPPGLSLPAAWSAPGAADVVWDDGTSRPHGYQLNLRSMLFSDATPRLIYADWYFERADLIAAALQYGQRVYGPDVAATAQAASTSAISSAAGGISTAGDANSVPTHPWLPDALAAEYRRQVSSGNLPGAPPGIPLSRIVVIHLRLGDAAMRSWQSALARPHYGMRADAGQGGGHGTGEGAAAAPRGSSPEWILSTEESALQQAPFTQAGWNAVWAYGEAHDKDMRETGQQHWDPRLDGRVLEAIEVDVMRHSHVLLPLSYYRAVLDGSAGQWDHVHIVTERDSLEHPLLRTLVSSYNATVQSRSVVEDMATLMAARQLVISASTFSYMAAMLGQAAVVHYPNAGYFSLRPDKGQCMLVRDKRFVYHDVVRAAVDGYLSRLSSGTSGETTQGSAAPFLMPIVKADCPSSDAAPGPYFMSYDELERFYRRPDCARKYMPGAVWAQVGEAAFTAPQQAQALQRVMEEGTWKVCTDFFELPYDTS